MPDLVTDGDNLGDHLATRSFKTIKGSDIASATNITIGTSGNTFDITGTTTIEHFDNANWAIGSVISLHFDGAVVLTNNAGGLTGNQANILLSGDANFTTATGDILTFLLHDSTNWQEVSRNSVASIPDGSITNAKLDTGIDAIKLADGSVTNTELKYINTLSDNAQSQLDAKSPTAGNTSLVTTGALNTGSITSGFGDINNGASTITTTGAVSTGAVTSTGLTSSGTVNLSGNNLDNIKNLHHNFSTSGTDIDFSEDQLQIISISANTTFTTVNRATGKIKTIRLLADGTNRVCTFPSGIRWLGVAPISNTYTVTASKYAIITFTSFGTTEADILGVFSVEA